MRKSIILMGLLAVLLGALFTGCQSVKKMEKQEYALGRTQGSGVAAFFDQGLLYKDNIKSGDELQFKGLLTVTQISNKHIF
ncbi:MAG: hypothetical protein Q4F21_07730 [Lachnospiraceae bacterium]|nr:hypothetical protein [Lachnospiraceae bacterium]